ncbi:hypothetical protein [Rhizobium laguerreae]|uniref:Uncharacterized protein n=1 Tax=Rhizobium laguerreae TaxID=1076926 RepID=A0AAX2QHZ5_9HYPH|nr:hypothetical protein [Rhizobium laguerreae]TCU18659.1 hypothetical protein EV131_114166 [Rhizobium laguerreae]
MKSLAALLHKVTQAVIDGVDLDFTTEVSRNTARDRIFELAATNGVSVYQDIIGSDAIPMDDVEELLMALAKANVMNAVDAVRLHVDYISQRCRIGV